TFQQFWTASQEIRVIERESNSSPYLAKRRRQGALSIMSRSSPPPPPRFQEYPASNMMTTANLQRQCSMHYKFSYEVRPPPLIRRYERTRSMTCSFEEIAESEEEDT
ncbi:hypothetical protein OSTOST_03716, partial [Ostertagia ostertagi]